MASNAQEFFQTALIDVENLLWFHENESGDAPGRRAAHFGSLNKSAIVLLCAAWESYIESVICEAATLNIDASVNPNAMLKSIRKLVGSHVRGAKDESTWQQIAGDGWRNVAKSVVSSRVLSLNTPKKSQITELMLDVLGVKNISDNWAWRKNPAGVPAEKLDNFVKLRGSISHGENLARNVTKFHVTSSRNLLTRLVDAVEDRLLREQLFAQ